MSFIFQIVPYTLYMQFHEILQVFEQGKKEMFRNPSFAILSQIWKNFPEEKLEIPYLKS